MANTDVYALDFDGVICDSAVETAVAGWKAAIHLWADMPEVELPPQQKIEQFRAFRPILETGYETIIFMRLLHEGIELQVLINHFQRLKKQFLASCQYSVDELKKQFGVTRDNWINQDQQQWIAMNPLFPGVAARLRSLEERYSWYIVTTKQERFVQQILAANQVPISADRIFGLDRNASKETILAELLQQHPGQQLIFIEDRLPTLNSVISNQKLNSIKLKLAAWGYNTSEDRQGLDNTAIELIDLQAFLA